MKISETCVGNLDRPCNDIIYCAATPAPAFLVFRSVQHELQKLLLPLLEASWAFNDPHVCPEC